MFRLLLTPAVLFAGFTTFAQADAIGVRDIKVAQSASGLALNAVVWYPTVEDGKTETVGENPAFLGIPAIRNASPDAGSHPLVVLSHGYGGSWRNLNWLAGELATKGYIVAATDQYSSARKASISRSRSTIRRSATDCTRPAERPRRTLSQRMGDTL